MTKGGLVLTAALPLAPTTASVTETVTMALASAQMTTLENPAKMSSVPTIAQATVTVSTSCANATLDGLEIPASVTETVVPPTVQATVSVSVTITASPSAVAVKAGEDPPALELPVTRPVTSTVTASTKCASAKTTGPVRVVNLRYVPRAAAVTMVSVTLKPPCAIATTAGRENFAKHPIAVVVVREAVPLMVAYVPNSRPVTTANTPTAPPTVPTIQSGVTTATAYVGATSVTAVSCAKSSPRYCASSCAQTTVPAMAVLLWWKISRPVNRYT